MAAEIEPPTGRARIVGIDIPFWDLVFLLVRLSMAAIPAAIILVVAWFIVGGFLVGVLGGFMHAMSRS